MAVADPQGMLWITDERNPGNSFRYAVSTVILQARTPFQSLAIVDTPAYGKALILDGDWQSCVEDEFLYHEPLVHPAMILHGAPKRVAILGGGEGATLREVLRWRSVERAVMIDLDGEVVEACRRYLPEMHQGAFDDLRAELLICDATEWLETTEERFDVLISDLSEPIENGPAYRLFTREYFNQALRVLEEDGIFALQAGSVAPNEIEVFARVANTVNSIFDHVRPYSSFVPSFSTPWGFLLATSAARGGLQAPPPELVNEVLSTELTSGLSMLDGEALHGILSTPAYIRRSIEGEMSVYTIENPPRI